MKRQEKMLTKGGGHVGVGIELGHRPATLHGDSPKGQLWEGGVRLFLLRGFFCLERQWNESCELLPVKPGSWACNLILGPPDVSSHS